VDLDSNNFVNLAVMAHLSFTVNLTHQTACPDADIPATNLLCAIYRILKTITSKLKEDAT